MLEKKTCEFYEASDVFEDCREAFNRFTHSEPECSWGDNHRTLVRASLIYDVLDRIIDDENDVDVELEIEAVMVRIKEQIGLDSYVDLEN
jgi:hypothetical protein